MGKPKVLFLCSHNSARSQMAEAWLNHLGGDKWEAMSAGLEAGELNPLAVEAMKEVGLDISEHKTKSVMEIIKRGILFSYVITVCDESEAEKCPVFPAFTRRLHWSIPDPAKLTGTHEEKLEAIRHIRDDIKKRILDFLKEN
ncbi:MAG: arsenate reductase ArsC [Syntrophales bacterium]|nr:arsenate reductase ArsC [Syntrophales bacterium]